ncbi:hypothetical protein C8R42DRAFT_780378 [Lentinula raphanica]|nr:hypothetical protein C8R42DRAFT_780378 [Lentinula raphanica]
MTRLPQELIDRFIDEFHDSIKDLKVLSLVATSWLQRARYHLFRSLTLVPQDLQAIRDSYADVKRRASLKYIMDPDDFLLYHERQFLNSPLAENPQSTQSFLSSITNTLPYVRGLRLLSYVEVGGKEILPREYIRDWLGYGGEEYALHCRVRGKSREDFLENQKARWDAVDLPWGHGAGLHALPFRNLRFLEIQWSVFSWTPPSERGLVDPTDTFHWPGYQLAMLINSNSDTLNHVCINEYPGFKLEQFSLSLNGDALLDLIAGNAPNLRSLCLRGLREPFYVHLVLDQPESFEEDFLSESRPLYPSGEEIPYITLDHNSVNTNPSLECLFIQGFDSESTILIEDAILNRGVFSVQNLSHLALSVMPKSYDYMFMFSKVHETLTHLTIDLEDSSSNLKLKFYLFPRLECLQLMIHSTYHTWQNLHNMIESLSDNVYRLDGTLPVVQVIRLLHISFGSHAHLPTRGFLLSASVDEFLTNLICMHSELPESMGQTQVQKITLDISETILAETLPITFWTGHLKAGKTNYWWNNPEYL